MKNAVPKKKIEDEPVTNGGKPKNKIKSPRIKRSEDRDGDDDFISVVAKRC